MNALLDATAHAMFPWATPKAGRLLLDWRTYWHQGKSVVPVNFHAEIDRAESRPHADEPNALAVESIFIKDKETNLARALSNAREVFGGAKNAHRKAGLSTRQVREWRSEFAREVDAIDLLSVRCVPVPQATKMQLFEEFRRAQKRDAVSAPRWLRIPLDHANGAP